MSAAVFSSSIDYFFYKVIINLIKFVPLKKINVLCAKFIIRDEEVIFYVPLPTDD
jgi:hypothetical protein